MKVCKSKLSEQDKGWINTLVGTALAEVYDRTGIHPSRNVIKKIEYHLWNGKTPHQIGKLFV